jgi:hypothetical protein
MLYVLVLPIDFQELHTYAMPELPEGPYVSVEADKF